MAVAVNPAAPVVEYPIQLGIAYLFLVGYLVRTLFVSLRLPASVGVIATGFAFSYFFQADIFQARDVLQELAFFLVLLTAGLEIRLQDLKPYIFMMALLPATCELLAIAAYGHMVMGFTIVEGLVLGTVLVALGDGLVIPKMKEFGSNFRGHPLPRLVFTWAPLEASFALALFGMLVGLSAPANQPHINFPLMVLANLVRIAATVLVGALLGAASGWLIPKRTQLRVGGKQVFTGASVESFLMVLAVALVAFGIGAGDAGKELVPMRFSPGSLFQPELLVIVTGTCFAAVADRQVLGDVDAVMGGVWVFGQLVLFSMLGSRTSPGIFPQLLHVLPIIGVGLCFRLAGIFVAIGLSLLTGASGHPFQRTTIIPDALFCFLSTIPRATIQGALGSVPVSQRFFQHCPQKHNAQEFIFTAARLYIVCMSICGMILLNTFGPYLCSMTADRPDWNSPKVEAEAEKAMPLTKACEDVEAQVEGDEADGAANVPPSEEGEAEVSRVAAALEVLAKQFQVSRKAVLWTLRAVAACEVSDVASDTFDVNELRLPICRTVSDPISIAQEIDTSLANLAKLRRPYPLPSMCGKQAKRRSTTRGLTLAQFECTGSLLKQAAYSPLSNPL
uniref:Cation/H+ exchanger domain-containing protein n=1 Tax=Alexandrium monilatum TaxID=311494 RepID=A0A7S4R9H3_9DINO